MTPEETVQMPVGADIDDDKTELQVDQAQVAVFRSAASRLSSQNTEERFFQTLKKMLSRKKPDAVSSAATGTQAQPFGPAQSSASMQTAAFWPVRSTLPRWLRNRRR